MTKLNDPTGKTIKVFVEEDIQGVFKSALDYDMYLRKLISCPPDMSLVNYLKGLVYLYEQTENFIISSETVDEFCVRVSNVFVNDVKKKIDHDSLSRAMSDS